VGWNRQVGSGEGSNQGSSTLDEEENNLGKWRHHNIRPKLDGT
jgi:hypothetical protein